MKITKRQKEVVFKLFYKFYNEDEYFRKEYDERALRMDKKELALWAAGYILKMTPESERISDIHKVDL